MGGRRRESEKRVRVRGKVEGRGRGMERRGRERRGRRGWERAWESGGGGAWESGGEGSVGKWRYNGERDYGDYGTVETTGYSSASVATLAKEPSETPWANC